MPLAVTHVLLTIIAIDLYRDYVMKKHSRYLTLHTVMIGGIAGLLPDIDIPLGWLLMKLGLTQTLLHGGITHTAFFGLIFLLPAIYFHRKKSLKLATIFYVVTFGILFHNLLDFLLGGGRSEGIMWLWPLSAYPAKLHILNAFGLYAMPEALDAIILLLWLWHEEVKHKIRDFI